MRALTEAEQVVIGIIEEYEFYMVNPTFQGIMNKTNLIEERVRLAVSGLVSLGLIGYSHADKRYQLSRGTLC